jgi:hypothetical protein
MPIDCPHCSAKIEDAHSQAAVDGIVGKRLKEKTTELETANAKAKLYDDARSAQTKAEERASAAEAKVGNYTSMVSATGGKVTDPKTLEKLQAIYTVEMSDTPEAERPQFSSWLGAEDGAKKSDIVGHLFVVNPNPNPANPDPANPNPANPKPPNPDTGGKNPGGAGAGKVSHEEARKLLSSEAYKRASNEDKVKMMDEMEARVAEPTDVR